MSRRARIGARALTAVLACAVFVSCGPKRRAPVHGGAQGVMGVYRAELRDADGERHRFRLLLWVEPPDRLHAEALTPVGSTALIVDGGDGRLSVVDPRGRAAWAGDADPEALRRVVGVRIGLAQLVGILLGEARPAPEGIVVQRTPDRPGLPRSLALRGAEGSLELERRRVAPLRTSTATLGTGFVPPGFEARPLEELGQVELSDGTGP